MYGQFGEVKILKNLVEKFDVPKTCIEFGAYDGITNSNTNYFWEKKKFKAFSLLSDGECNEGSIWEAALLAPTLKLDNLIAIIDYNKWQATGRSKEIMSLEPLTKKWDSFGWHTQEIDGHNFKDMKKAFKEIEIVDNKPHIIIAHTIKGKGVSFMEDNNNWHYRTPNERELEMALKEINK